MNRREEIKKGMLEHCKKYPALQPADFHKYIYQSVFGCEHLLTDEAGVVEYIFQEARACGFCNTVAETDRIEPNTRKTNTRKANTNELDTGDFVEMLDGEYCRVHLACLQEGLFVSTLGKLFVLSAEKTEGNETEHRAEKLYEMLEAMRELAEEGQLPFSDEAALHAASAWKAQGCPACHHSEQFRSSYKPAYRVIRKEYVKYLPLLIRVDIMLKGSGSGMERSDKRVLLALEGGSASGKTTLAALLQKIYGAALFHMDDFFLRPEQRTPQRFAEVGGNVDRERFLQEVLRPLSKGEKIIYRPFDCASFKLGEAVEREASVLNVVEGVYSMHPELAEYYDLSVFLEIGPELQKRRIEKRNTPKLAERFFSEWIPMEQRYFKEMNVKNRCGLTITIEDTK